MSASNRIVAPGKASAMVWCRASRSPISWMVRRAEYALDRQMNEEAYRLARAAYTLDPFDTRGLLIKNFPEFHACAAQLRRNSGAILGAILRNSAQLF